MSDDDKIKRLPVRFKTPQPPGKTLVGPHEVGNKKCYHSSSMGAAYVIDESLAEVECSLCRAKLNPMWVLKQLAGRDNLFQESHRRYQEEMRRLQERSKTKCRNCGEMTPISHR